MSTQLRKNCTQIQISISQSVLLFALPLKLQGALQIHQSCSQFSGFSIITGVIVISDGCVFGIFEAKRLALFKKHETQVKFFFLEQDHGYDVAKLTQFDRSFLIFLAGCAEEILIDIKDFLIDIKGLFVFALFLKYFCLLLKGLYFLFDCGVHVLCY